jgi:predicted DNA-binding transcriptional regulator AlpA
MTDLLDVRDLAAIYKTTPKGIHTRRSRSPKTLPPAFKLGGKVVWSRETVDAWLKTQEREQTDLRSSDAA